MYLQDHLVISIQSRALSMSTIETSILNYTLLFKILKKSEPYYIFSDFMTKLNYFIIVNDYYYFKFSHKEYIINYKIFT